VTVGHGQIQVHCRRWRSCRSMPTKPI